MNALDEALGLGQLVEKDVIRLGAPSTTSSPGFTCELPSSGELSM